MPVFSRRPSCRARQAAAVAVLLALQSTTVAHAQIDVRKSLLEALTGKRNNNQGIPPGMQIKGYDQQKCAKAANWIATDTSSLPPEFVSNGRFGANMNDVQARPRTQAEADARAQAQPRGRGDADARGRGEPVARLPRTAENADQRRADRAAAVETERVAAEARKYGPLADVTPSGIPRDNWLLEDSRFTPEFGKTYDQLSSAESADIQRLGISCQMVGRTPSGITVDMRMYARSFGSDVFPAYAKGVQTIRATRQQVREVYVGLDGIPATDDGYNIYLQVAANAPRLRGFMSASDLALFNPRMIAAYERVAKPAMERQAQRYLANAQGYDGLVAVNQLINVYIGSDGETGARRQPTVQSLLAKQDEVARQVQRVERGHIDALGGGLAGLERGIAYSRELDARFRKYANVGPIRELWEEFQAKREATIESARPELARRIGQTWNIEGIEALLARYVPFKLDQEGAAGSALFSRARQQRDEIDKRAVLGENYAAAKMSAQAVKRGEPSESDMYDALKRHFDYKTAVINSANGMCQGFDGKEIVSGIACLGVMGVMHIGGGDPIKISKFAKHGCAGSSPTSGFLCNYNIAVTGGPTGFWGQFSRALYAAGGDAQAMFLKPNGTWTVRTD